MGSIHGIEALSACEVHAASLVICRNGQTPATLGDARGGIAEL